MAIESDIQRDSIPTDRPGALLHLDFLAEFAIKDGLLALETHQEFFLEDLDVQISRAGPFGNRDYDVDFTQFLFPCVGEG